MFIKIQMLLNIWFQKQSLILIWIFFLVCQGTKRLYHKMDPSGNRPLRGINNLSKQAGAELGQAQLKLGLGFTSTIDSK